MWEVLIYVGLFAVAVAVAAVTHTEGPPWWTNRKR
jgi:hypothetical protein